MGDVGDTGKAEGVPVSLVVNSLWRRSETAKFSSTGGGVALTQKCLENQARERPVTTDSAT
jgi:hypothetical protein